MWHPISYKEGGGHDTRRLSPIILVIGRHIPIILIFSYYTLKHFLPDTSIKRDNAAINELQHWTPQLSVMIRNIYIKRVFVVQVGIVSSQG